MSYIILVYAYLRHRFVYLDLYSKVKLQKNFFQEAKHFDYKSDKMMYAESVDQKLKPSLTEMSEIISC